MRLSAPLSFNPLAMKTLHGSFSVHGVFSSLPLSEQGPDGLPMPGCWQKVRGGNSIDHFEHGTLCKQGEQNKGALKINIFT